MSETAPMPDPFLPPSQRRAIVASYGHEYGLSVFVETGTANGDTPWTLKNQFEKLYTIEVDGRLYRAARVRFEGTNVTCLHGDSADVLPAVLRELTGPALFWLDGHRCTEGDEGRGAKDCPIIEELDAIFATEVEHVVLVDDARLFDGMPYHDEQPNWPHIDEVELLARRHGYGFEVEHDIIRLEPMSREPTDSDIEEGDEFDGPTPI